MSQETSNHSFDELARALANGSISRGKALRLMGAALVGSALGSAPGVAWANDCRPLGRECRRDSQYCSRNCIRRGDDKVCGCPEGKTRCNDRCVNLDRSEHHCGRCGKRCAEGEECMGGECKGTCPGTPVTEGDCLCAINCDPNTNPDQFTCGDNPNCLCDLTIEGEGFCAAPGGTGECPEECSSSDDCEAGQKCVVTACGCDHPICARPCTPTCLPDGGTCGSNSQCCSGICKGATAEDAGQCVASCIPEATACVDLCTNPSCTCAQRLLVKGFARMLPLAIPVQLPATAVRGSSAVEVTVIWRACDSEPQG